MTFYYSDLTTNTSKGGAISLALASGVNNLFSTIAQYDLLGIEEYRCIYLKNDSLTKNLKNIQIYLPEIQTSQVLNPNLLSPQNGDQWIVPSGALNEWADYVGYIATYNSGWVYSTLFSTFELGTESGTAQVLNDVYQAPYGVTFYPTTETSAFNISFLGANTSVAIWIKRKVGKRIINKTDLEIYEIETNHNLSIIETQKIYSLADEYNSYKITYSGENSFIKNTEQTLNFNVLLNELGEQNYTGVSIALRTKLNSNFDATKILCNANFQSVDYTNIQNLTSFSSFDTTNDLNETLILTTTFLNAGLYTLYLDLIESDIIIQTNSFQFTILAS